MSTGMVLPQTVDVWTILDISHMILMTNEYLVGTTHSSVLVTVETRDGVGRETDTTSDIETETGSVTQTTEEIETGIVTTTENGSTPNRRDPGNYLITSMT